MTQTQTFDYNNYRSIKILRHCIWTRSINVSVVLRRVPRQTMSRCVPLRRPRPVWLLLYVKLLRYLGTTFFETFYFWTLDPLHFRWMNAPIFVSRNAVVFGGGFPRIRWMSWILGSFMSFHSLGDFQVAKTPGGPAWRLRCHGIRCMAVEVPQCLRKLWLQKTSSQNVGNSANICSLQIRFLHVCTSCRMMRHCPHNKHDWAFSDIKCLMISAFTSGRVIHWGHHHSPFQQAAAHGQPCHCAGGWL